jgi:proteasome lid subunit RPN8/RPN11
MLPTAALILTVEAYEMLLGEARSAYPNECCGVLGGRDGAVERVYPVPNVASKPRSRYEMAPASVWDARCRARAEGFDVVGFYHSHPRTRAAPSTYDIERAYYPEAVYVIVGIESEPRVRAFRIVSGEAGEIPVTVDRVRIA